MDEGKLRNDDGLDGLGPPRPPREPLDPRVLLGCLALAVLWLVIIWLAGNSIR